jgi:hypothetical protein
VSKFEHTRKAFEDRTFNRRFLCGITKVSDSQFAFAVNCPPQHEFVQRGDDGEYLDETLRIMWWAWNEAMEESTKLKPFFANFEGRYLGATAFVVAKNKEDALSIINDHRVLNGISDKTAPSPDEVEEVVLTVEGCPYFDNGDY